jgi:hypothetical protein
MNSGLCWVPNAVALQPTEVPGVNARNTGEARVVLVIGSVEHSEREDRYRFCALHGPGLDVLKGGNYSRALLDLYGTIVDVSIVRGRKTQALHAATEGIEQHMGPPLR